MTFGEKLKYAAFGCLFTLAGVLLSSSVLPLFATSDRNASFDTVFCKSLTIGGDKGGVLAILGNSRQLLGENEERGVLTLSHKDSDLHEISSFTNTGLVLSDVNHKNVVTLNSADGSGNLMLNSSKDDGTIMITETDSGFGIGIFGSDGVGTSGGASLGVQENTGQITLFGANTEILFGRGEFIYGE